MKKTSYTKESPQVQLTNMMNLFYNANPFVKSTSVNHEVEVKFGTKGIKYLTKIDYDNVIRKLKSLGFHSENESGNYYLRIYSEYLDPKTGTFKLSNSIRTEIDGFHAIQEYCKNNDIKQLIHNDNFRNSIRVVDKASILLDPANRTYLRDAVFSDFNFSVSYKTEKKIPLSDKRIVDMFDQWSKTKKTFRYINRVAFTHPDFPVQFDISIVKNSGREKDGSGLKKTYDLTESSIFKQPDNFDIEIEIINDKIGPGTEFNTPKKIEQVLRKAIQYALSGMQNTNYPISVTEQREVLQQYYRLLHPDVEKIDRRITSSDFIGPQSYTLQMQNIVPLHENVNTPSIRENYVVTDKADGERHLLFVSSKQTQSVKPGRIYLINTNMDVIFTGAYTENNECMNSLVDGELVLHDKFGQFINLFIAFDMYYENKKDIRDHIFVSLSQEEKEKEKEKVPRYRLLKNMMRNFDPKSILVEKKISPLRVGTKDFYPLSNQSIFSACSYILKKENDGLFEYNTDGLIFTHALFGVGAGKQGTKGPLHKTTWDYSFKWKPPAFNTIDFLVSTLKNTTHQDIVVPIFEKGQNNVVISSLQQYKTLILQVGFDAKKHGFLNPCQDVLDDILPEHGNVDDEEKYKPQRFYPTKPYDTDAGITNIMLKEDGNGVLQMKTEDGEVFEDNTIVEFKYDTTRDDPRWRWIPIRVRYDKTSELRQSMMGLGKPNYGNAYHVADSNWKSIHNPITSLMISTGQGIPESDTMEDEDVYYNRVLSSSKTRGLRDFHNLFVKKKLISSVSKKGDILIDYACGKGGDFPKWIQSDLSFVFGIDLSKDNLENRLDGACARFLQYRKSYKNMPYALFVNGDSRLNIKSGQAMLNDKAKQITKAVFGTIPKSDSMGKGVLRQYAKGEQGFQISSCQFAVHYFTENIQVFQEFMRNVAECTALDGYFIGTSYDGKRVFQLLKNKKEGESIEIYDDNVKIWEIRKEYNQDTMEDDASSLGYKIDVFQESINKMTPEYLVNYDYFHRVMEDYGFKLISREEAQNIGLPEATGMFSELFSKMEEEVKRDRKKKNDYGEAMFINSFEKKISFLNRYFIYKKTRNINAAKVALEEMEAPAAAVAAAVSNIKKTKAKSLKKTLVLIEEKEEESKEKKK